MPTHITENKLNEATTAVDIEKLVYGGEGLARQEGQVILVPFVLPGEKVSVTPERVKNGLMRASTAQVLQRSPQRIEPRCEYFADCGGCHLQQTGHVYQVEQKLAILRETLQRLGSLTYEAEIPAVSGEPWNYRNRVQLHFQDGKSGFHRAGSHDIRSVSHCEIASPLLNQTIALLQGAVRQTEWPKFLRSLEIFSNESQIQITVLDSNRAVAARFFDWTKGFLPPQVDGAIEYQALGHTFRISRGSFFQTNRFLLDQLVNVALGDSSGEHAVDLYAGVGLFTLPLSQRFKTVDAVERGGPAFHDLEWNAAHAGATNIRPRRGSAEEFLPRNEGKPELIVADPPRAGLGPTATAELLRILPPQLTIVSCDPATLARDLRKLLPGGYAVEKITLVDLFPQTYHFETVVHLRRA
ncbi:MAG TPA: class I SAM-dependent RNA methyltransferase [Bryobacteraceae bacterium]|nr:class I SAM-dependent RNA methyltransferase [Bryobacteraceae bacterium]